jgi:aryl-alcohol dehydrogenase-like predicted oxidoreductase
MDRSLERTGAAILTAAHRLRAVRRVELPGTGVQTSALGYGCSQLMTRAGRSESVRLLELAFDAGITHFDAARAYGYGEAEGALGTFLRGRRDRVTVTTKLGLDPPRRSRGLAAAKSVARSLVAVAPPLRAVARRGAATIMRSGRFALPEVRTSVETSLRELGTDGVDLLLLHVCRPDDLTDELLDFLRECVDAGRTRAFGIATGPEESSAILAQRPEFAPVVQVENAITRRTVETVPELWRAGVITHSTFLGLDELARERPGPDRAAVAERMLTWALEANPDGVVLFSSSNPEHVRRNVAAAA